MGAIHDFDWFASRLDIARTTSDVAGKRDIHANCPVHGGSDSLHVTEKNGRALVVCLAERCDYADIVAALDDATPTTQSAVVAPTVRRIKRKGSGALDAFQVLADYCGVDRSVLDSLPITDGGDGEPLFHYPSGAVKRRHWDGDAKYTWDEDVKPRPVWPVEADVPEEAWFTEGETDAIVLRALGVTAYSLGSTSDSKAAGDDVWDALRSRGLKRAIIAGDADEAGRKATTERMASALSAGLRAVAVTPPDYDPLTGASKDWRSWFLAGGSTLPEPVGAAYIVPMAGYLDTHAADDIEWAVEGLAYFGGVAMLAGPMKGGKTTLLENALRLVGGSDEFLGRWTVADGLEAALFTEEGAVTIRANLGHLGIHVVSRRDKVPSRWSLAEAVAEALDWLADHPRALIVFDTYDKWASIEDENDASANVEAIETFYALAAAGAAVLVIHHSRKGGGDYGEGIRGSGAILGAVDHAVELKYATVGTDRRIIEMHGRVLENTRRIVDFDRSTMTYTLVDEAAEANAALLTMLDGIPRFPDDPDGMARADLEALWGVTDGRKRIAGLMKDGLLRRSDTPVKVARGSEYRYWRSDPVANLVSRSNGPVV